MNTILKSFLSLALVMVCTPAFTQAPVSEVVLHSSDHNTRIVKFYFFSPLAGKTAFGYEQMLKPGVGLDLELGIIGLGVSEAADNSSGLYITVGPRFYVGQDFHIEGMTDVHPLRGTYFKPEIAISAFHKKDIHSWWGASEPISANVYSGALLLNIGKQWVMANRFSVDFHIGAGYAISNKIEREVTNWITGGTEKVSYPVQRKFAYTSFEPDFPFAIKTGINIGYAF